jgi:cellulose synthase (UDP-forming)
LDELSALWSFYRHHYIEGGRVVSLDEDRITTSEGQSYALLRAVWANDPWTFAEVWQWTRQHLQVRGDRLFAWKWKDRVLDANSATDADVDIALALILASRRFDAPAYGTEALAILDDIWAKDVLHVGNRHYVSAGSWAPGEAYPVLHVAYFAPYAYEVFAGADPRHPWQALVTSSYQVLHWLYFDERVRAPPEIVYVDRRTGQLHLAPPKGRPADFGYDSVPLFWRLAVDEKWFSRGERKLRRQVLSFFESEWRTRGRILDRYTTAGTALTELEGLPHLASIHALALVDAPDLAAGLRAAKLSALFGNALSGIDTPYYLHNWVWFGRAFELGIVRHYDEFLGFLRPFDFEGFAASFPWALGAAALVLAPLARRSRAAKIAFLLVALAICVRYLGWRFGNTLNFYETLGPVISIGLWLAELYSFSTVVLLAVQMGTRTRTEAPPRPTPDPLPTVDVLIPIYSESLEILDKTLTAATAMRYPAKRIYVCDDSHRDAVAQLAAEHGAAYIRGPRKHAKAGNLNQAIAQTDGELIAVFDTDHVPVETFLDETVPCFSDPGVGFVQTPHHFYNPDIFQRALGAGSAVPNEQDMFNHAIQAGRDSWGGAFFVGSGAVFRRRAIAGLGGFKLMSITEDIHTSQHLHAAGWKSVFVDKDLAVGLTAENLAGYLVQRRRWMLGCLQIFFRDNPLFCRGLSLRHRLGYFASLYYFFFPLARVVFWVTPLMFLLFHLHPLFADVSVLLAYLLPYLVVLPLASRLLVPGWPRFMWGTSYEMATSFSLARAMLDLILPARLGFKVTPKGITSEKRRFDLASSRLTLVAAAITAIAVVKGLFEVQYFGIERDAYFFNLLWAGAYLIQLSAALLVGWEKPQRRGEERISRQLPVAISAGDFRLNAVTVDVSLSGAAIMLDEYRPLSRDVEVRFENGPAFCARVVHHERRGRAFRLALEFVAPTPESRRQLTRLLFSDPAAWEGAHERHTRSSLVMGARFVIGLVRSLRSPRARCRRAPRERAFGRWRCVHPGGARAAWLLDRGEHGVGFVVFGRRPLSVGTRIPVLEPSHPARWARIAYQKRWWILAHRVGLDLERELPRDEPEASSAYFAQAA